MAHRCTRRRLILASWAKLTALLLVGGLVGGVLLWRGRLPSGWVGLIAIAALLGVAPYIGLFAQYGSPTPKTPEQIAMIKSGALAVGWDSAERMTPASYAAQFVSEFVLEWMPILKPRNALNYVTLMIPITAALCAFVGFLVAVQRIAYEKAGPLDIVVAAGMRAFAGTFFIHAIFGYELHTEFSWLTTAYPRYYVPLAAIVPLAGLSLLGAIKQPAASATLLVSLIAGPFGLPLIRCAIGIGFRVDNSRPFSTPTRVPTFIRYLSG